MIGTICQCFSLSSSAVVGNFLKGVSKSAGKHTAVSNLGTYCIVWCRSFSAACARSGSPLGVSLKEFLATKTSSSEVSWEGSLEVKLPTIWTVGKAEVGRVRDEKRNEKIREEKE